MVVAEREQQDQRINHRSDARGEQQGDEHRPADHQHAGGVAEDRRQRGAPRRAGQPCRAGIEPDDGKRSGGDHRAAMLLDEHQQADRDAEDDRAPPLRRPERDEAAPAASTRCSTSAG